MILEHLTIINYKNIPEADLTFSPALNCITGQNGQGKTNLLDAIRFLSLGKSMSTGMDRECIKHGCDSFMLRATYRQDASTVSEKGSALDIHCTLKAGGKKVIRRQGKAYQRLSDHIGLIPVVLVSPIDNMLILGGSEERRRFMDVVICQMDNQYLETLNRYNKALQQRNSLLHQDETPDVEMLAIWEEQMAENGEYIFKRRNSYVESLTPIFQEYYNLISGGNEKVNIHYTSHCQRGPLIEVIQRDRNKDIAIGYSLHGIHRDDLEIFLEGFPIRREGSQGQNKTTVVALKLAQYEFLRQSSQGITPLLLLDDIFDRLDAERVERIVKLVGSDRFGQTFITDTNRSHLDSILDNTKLNYRIFNCTEGTYAETQQ